MLNESRVKLMTKLAAYEGGEGKRNMAIGTYFRGDYISKEIIKSIIYGTLCYCILVATYVVYHLEELMELLYDWDYMLNFGKLLLKYYAIMIVGYSVVTYIVYAVRYHQARKKLRIYYNNLRRLNSMYRKESDGNGGS